MKIFPHAQISTPISIEIERRILLEDFGQVVVGFGSCFAQNMQESMRRYGFRYWYKRDICAHYSTESIANRLEAIAQKAAPGDDDLYHFANPQRVHAYTYFLKRHYFGEDAPQRLHDIMAQSTEECRTVIQTASIIVITLGTSRVMRLKRNGRVITLNQGIPVCECNFEMLSVSQNVQQLQRIVDAVREIRAGDMPKIILTISPQRYLFPPDDLPGVSPYVDNVVQKSILRAAVYEFMEQCAEADLVYFPSYELVIDELRTLETLSHYDHVHIDQVHTPEYICKRLFQAHASDTVQALLELSDQAIHIFHETDEWITGGLPADHKRIEQKLQGWIDKALRVATPDRWPRNAIMALARMLQRAGWDLWLVELLGDGGYHPYTRYDLAISMNALGRTEEALKLCGQVQAELDSLPFEYPGLQTNIKTLLTELEQGKTPVL